MGALSWSVRTVDRALDGETVYRELLAGEPVAFWLDGSLTDRAVRRVSVLGTTLGPARRSSYGMLPTATCSRS